MQKLVKEQQEINFWVNSDADFDAGNSPWNKELSNLCVHVCHVCAAEHRVIRLSINYYY